MRFERTHLADAHLITAEPKTDHRGSFTRTYCEKEFTAAGLPVHWVQSNLSTNLRRGTLRGMHFQQAPNEEAKIVRCTRGAIYDVIIDIRPLSPTYKRWQGFELSAKNQNALYVPAGFAHGLQTTEDDTEVLYFMGAFYDASAARGIRWNDPEFGITWPMANPILSPQDADWPDFQP